MTPKPEAAGEVPGRLRWKLSEPERGLCAVIAGPRSSWLHDGVRRYAHVMALGRGRDQWFWVAGWDSGIPHKNTCDTPQSLAEAKADAERYVRAALSTPKEGSTK